MNDAKKTKAELTRELEALREEVKALEELKESEQKFRNLAESIGAQISIIQDDRYVYANQAFLDYNMLAPEDLSLVTPEDLMLGALDEETIARATREWQEAMSDGGTRFHFEYEDAEGNWYQMNITMMELGGKPATLAAEFDITELKRAQNEMYRADKMAALGQIVAGVAHEINNPNNFIYFNLPILRKYIAAIEPILETRLEENPDLELLGMPYRVFLDDVYKILENMEHGSARITGIVSDLKNYVRGDEDQERKPALISEVADRVMNLVGKQVRKMVKQLDVEIDEGLPPVEMNMGKIEQVLINLLINAGHAADKEESWVKLSARAAERPRGWVSLTVEDNGTGIPDKNIEHIFEPFFTSKGRDQGTGLGLFVSHRIIEEHGGKISALSTCGQGTRFTILLPAKTAQ